MNMGIIDSIIAIANEYIMFEFLFAFGAIFAFLDSGKQK
jgi:hypothetical protein